MKLRRFAITSLLTVLGMGALTVTAVPAGALTSQESQFVSLHNQARTSRGISSMVVHSDLVTVARQHSQEMAAKGTIWHNSNLSNEVSGWSVLGENVGMGPTVPDLFTAFMNSTSHRANILDRDYNQFGVGVVIAKDSTIFVTVVFAQRKSSSTSTSTPRPISKVTASTTPTLPAKSTASLVTTRVVPVRALSSVASRAAASVAAARATVSAPQRMVNMIQMLIAMDAAFVNPLTGEALAS